MIKTESSNYRAESPLNKLKTRKFARTAFAAVISVGMVGTFALPAYSVQPVESVAFASQAPQQLTTLDVPETEFAVEALKVGDNLELLEIERAAEEERIAQELAAEQVALAELQAEQAANEPAAETESAPAEAAPAVSAVPASASAGGLAGAAAAQVGIGQDCTDLVQNTLAAMGYDTRRDQGGYDRGPGLGDWTSFGTTLPGNTELLPGDILVWEGAHVAIASGDGMAVHGGVGAGGLGTAVLPVSAAWAGPVPTAVVRPN